MATYWQEGSGGVRDPGRPRRGRTGPGARRTADTGERPGKSRGGRGRGHRGEKRLGLPESPAVGFIRSARTPNQRVLILAVPFNGIGGFELYVKCSQSFLTFSSLIRRRGAGCSTSMRAVRC